MPSTRSSRPRPRWARRAWRWHQQSISGCWKRKRVRAVLWRQRDSCCIAPLLRAMAGGHLACPPRYQRRRRRSRRQGRQCGSSFSVLRSSSSSSDSRRHRRRSHHARRAALGQPAAPASTRPEAVEVWWPPGLAARGALIPHRRSIFATHRRPITYHLAFPAFPMESSRTAPSGVVVSVRSCAARGRCWWCDSNGRLGHRRQSLGKARADTRWTQPPQGR
jgi:hypothetical protein